MGEQQGWQQPPQVQKKESIKENEKQLLVEQLADETFKLSVGANQVVRREGSNSNVFVVNLDGKTRECKINEEVPQDTKGTVIVAQGYQSNYVSVRCSYFDGEKSGWEASSVNKEVRVTDFIVSEHDSTRLELKIRIEYEEGKEAELKYKVENKIVEPEFGNELPINLDDLVKICKELNNDLKKLEPDVDKMKKTK
jgi:hypothetical protein